MVETNAFSLFVFEIYKRYIKCAGSVALSKHRIHWYVVRLPYYINTPIKCALSVTWERAEQLHGWAPSHGMCWAIVWVSPVTCTQYKCCRRSHKEQYNQCCFHITTFFYSTMSWWWSYWTPDPGKNVNFVRDNHMIMYAVWIQLSI